MDSIEPKTFQDAVDLVEKRADVIVLSSDDEKSKILVSPRLQGRVMTSTFAGDSGASLGWINAEVLTELDADPQFSNYGGEDRFWLGPEGGQFSIFFEMGAPQTMEIWNVPDCIGKGSFEVRTRGVKHVIMCRTSSVKNAVNTIFNVTINRDVSLLERENATQMIGFDLPASIEMVGFRSDNRLKNIGEKPWTEAGGLLSIWILGMFNPSKKTVVILPYKNNAEGIVVKDDYFGKVPAERLKILDGCATFLTDGQFRSKIGLPPGRALPLLGSYDFIGNVLTIVDFTLPDTDRFVNSSWEYQKEPFRGDVSNSYNDGPAQPGGPSMGGFYELESSSPALDLAPEGEALHSHATYHFHGPRKELAKIARKLLNADIDEVENNFFK